MKSLIVGAALAALLSCPAMAALKAGDKAPPITTTVALAGKQTPFNLASALKKGPVVLYFFPAAFTKGCTLEAHEFAEASEDFHKAGATIIGMTAGNADRIAEFSTVECRDKFAVGAATPEVITAYDVANATHPGYTARVSYVIAKGGKIAFVHDDPDYAGHVKGALAAVQALKH